MQSEVLIDKDQISKRVEELGSAVSDWVAQSSEPLEVLWLAEGAVVFIADLIRAINVDMKITSLKASSYGDAFKSSGNVDFKGDFEKFSGKNVLIVDDIFDTGLTLSTISAMVREAGANDVKACVLLRKEGVNSNFDTPEFVGFSVPNKYVFGYGLDAAGMFRNLPEIRVVIGG